MCCGALLRMRFMIVVGLRLRLRTGCSRKSLDLRLTTPLETQFERSAICLRQQSRKSPNPASIVNGKGLEMETKLHIRFREVYGRVSAYPANDQAERLAGLVGTKTLTESALRQALAMGFEVWVVAFTGRIGEASFGRPVQPSDLARLAA